MPRVSVIVPVHNAERHLPACLESIRHQTLDDLEIILVDDGSTDSSAAILADFAALDPRACVIAGPAQGSAGAARNAGLAVSTGDYLAFLDADDYFAPTMLSELHGKAVADRADVVACKFEIFNEKTRETTRADWVLRLEHLPHKRPFSPDDVGDHLFYSFNPAAWNKLFRAEFVRAHNLAFQPLRRTNDAYFTFMALALAERITYLDRYLATYRTANTDSLQGTIDESPLEFAKALEAMRATLKETGRWQKLERAFVNQALVLCLTNLKRPKTPAGFLEAYTSVRADLFARFGILDRPAAYFLRPGLARDRDLVVASEPEEYLFVRWRQAREQQETAQAEARRSLREMEMRAARPASAPQATVASEPSVPADSVPDVSVIIPVYNTLPFLAECLASVQRQTGCSLEVVCVDDGSTDGSADLLDEIAAQDQRIRVIHQPNQGLSEARNAGVIYATGRYLCFLDSDDYWQLDGLAGLVQQADRDDLDVLMFDAVPLREPDVDDRLWEKHRVYYQQRQQHEGVRDGAALLGAMRALREYRASACLYLVRRDQLVTRGLRFYPGIAHEDNLFTFDLMLHAHRAGHAPTALYARRVRPGSIVTAGAQASAARGYFITCVEMLRLVAGRTFGSPAVDAEIGSVVYRAFRALRNAAVELPEEVLARLAEIDPAPDAQAVFYLVRRAHKEEQDSRLLARRLKNASRPVKPGWRRHPLVLRVKPVVKRLIGRG